MATYLAKWKKFSICLVQKDVSASQTSAPCILSCLLHLKQQGLLVSSIRVHLAAISAFHPAVNGRSVFSKSLCSHFLKGLDGLYPQVWQLIPPWDLTLVLSRFTGRPFKPLATCSLLVMEGLPHGHHVSQEGFSD